MYGLSGDRAEGGGSPNKIHVCTEKESLSSFMRGGRGGDDDEDGKKKWADAAPPMMPPMMPSMMTASVITFKATDAGKAGLVTGQPDQLVNFKAY